MPGATKFGAEFYVGYFGEPSIAYLTAGRFVVAWHSDDALNTTPGEIKAQLFNADGSEAGAEFAVNTIFTAAQARPTVTTLSDGRFVVAWDDASQTSGALSNRDVRAQIFNSDGAKSGGEFLVNTGTDNVDDFPTITALANGRFVVAWHSFTDIDAQIFDGSGNKVGGEIQVETTFREDQDDPSIATLADGRFVVAWHDQAASQGSEIRAQVFTAEGAKSGVEFVVNTTVTGAQDEPAVAGLGDGRFVIVWEDGSRVSTEFNSDVRGQIFNGDGSKYGGEFLANTTTLSQQASPVVAALGNGGFVVAWDGSQIEITAQVFNADGSKSGGELIADTTTSGRQDIGAIAAFADHFVVAWRDFANQLGVDAQVFKLDGGHLRSNVDGHAFDDVVFRSVSTGQLIYQDMNAGVASGFDAITNPLPGWSAVGTGDISGDGRADVMIWNSASGFVYSVLPGASATPSFGLVAGGINGTYSALGVTDINGDGHADLLVREANSGSIFWQNATNGVWAYVGINIGSAWNYQAAGDVSHDGFSDVVIRDTSGLVYIANMANGQNSGYIDLGNLSGYQIRAVADVNADGYADVVVQRESDGWTLWRNLSGSGPAWNVASDPVGTEWIVKAAADVDNDGSADLIYQNQATGETLYRAMDAGVGTGWQFVSSPLGTDYLVV